MTRWAYLGPPGTYSEEALLRVAAHDDLEPVAVRTERDAVLAVERGDVDAAVVPIENAIEGAVTGTLDALALDTTRVCITGEVVVPVRHCLIGRAGEPIAEVVSHPQALAQCRRFLAEELPGAVEVAATSTADAVRSLAGVPGRAAIASRRAADLHGGDVLREDVGDDPGNATRFVALGREPAPDGGAQRKTTLIFHGGGDAAPGWLVSCLAEFADRGVNLSKIESRPRKVGLGHYLFVLDCSGGIDEPAVAGAVEALRGHCEEVRVLGSYRAAE